MIHSNLLIELNILFLAMNPESNFVHLFWLSMNGHNRLFSLCFRYVNMYPLGDKYSTKSLSLFLHLHDPKELPDPKSGMMIELTLSILDVKHGKHFTRKIYKPACCEID